MTQHRTDAVGDLVAGLRGKYFRTARDAAFDSQLDKLLMKGADGAPLPRPATFTATGETRGIIVIDGPGGGKTSLVNRSLIRRPALQTTDPTRVPWIGVRAPSPATLKSLGLEVLRSTGYEDVSERRERWSIWNLVRHRLEVLGAVVLWIDEAHDLFISGTVREVNDMLKMLKSLMQGPGAVIVVLTGIGELGRITACDGQVKRRYRTLMLPEVTEAKDGAMLEMALQGYCRMAGLAAPEEPELIGRLIHASRGRLGRCFESIINAIELALEAGHGALDTQHFAEAFAQQEACEPARNVFLSPRWSRIDLDAPALVA